MREKVEIVWLEDNPHDRGHKNRMQTVKDKILSKGYTSSIRSAETLEQAKSIIDNPENRVDFFISDFNLDSDRTGLDYLLEIRRKQMYKQFFIMYSKNDYDQIRDDVIKKLKMNKIDLFCNFTFFSLAGNTNELIRKELCNAVDISLSRWDELNAVRGLYMCEHAELEYKLREKLRESDINKSYKDLFCELKNKTTNAYKKMHENSFSEWEKLIDCRNLLAHVTEGYDTKKGYFIQSKQDDETVIYENSLDDKRSDLRNLKKKLEFLIENPNRPYNDKL